MTKNKEEILKPIKNSRNDIESLMVRKPGLFGSFVRRKQNSKSYINLLIEFSPNKENLDNFIHLSFLLKTLLKYPMQLVTFELLTPYSKRAASSTEPFGLCLKLLILEVPR